jgi:hypothetical protein
MFDQILAVMLFIIVINSLKRLTMGVKARYTSWGMFVLLINGFLFLRLPQAAGLHLDPVYVWVERFIAYTIAIILNCWDWLEYAYLKEKENQQDE